MNMEKQPLSASRLEQLTYAYPMLKDFTLEDKLSAGGISHDNGHILHST
jgi:hypothetical protein